ncbi:hypothetical protein GCM10027517_04610 [Phycicoccus ginsengisoli]
MNDLRGDELAALRAMRRVDDAELAAVTDRHALSALREGITMTDRNAAPTVEAPRRGRRLGRRGMAAGALGLVLVGSGAAYATYQHWYAGGALDGLTCMTRWQDPGRPGLDATGGPTLSGDPVADCQRYQQLSGRPEIPDPVAFTRGGSTSVFVAPHGQVPADGTPVATSAAGQADAAGALRLDAGLGDWVDGGASRCFTRENAPAYLKGEIARLGLRGWTVTVMPDNRPYEDGPCGFFDTDPATRTARFYPDRRPDPSTRRPEQDVAGSVYDVRDALRTGIADTCVSTTRAEQVAAKALGAEHHWPTPVVPTDARCASVDLVVGGSIQIWIYGPAVAKP